MDPLSKLASAIATAEGFFHPDPNTLPRRLHNPGDLMFAEQLGARKVPVKGADGKTRNFAGFLTDEYGTVALYRQILKRAAEGFTLRRLICDPVSGWAPMSDGNDTNNYLLETIRRTDIQPDVELMKVLTLERIP